ncbi:MAG TPA: thiol-disulfide isomerase [Terriglobales bacterium]|nr:thiol-disulfide isomerase [Terriglobales bacterium]
MLATFAARGQRPAPTFYGDVLPILERHCQVCHRAGGLAPMPFETYRETRAFAPAIAHAAQTRAMPPWFADPRFGHFANDPSLSAADIAALVAWARAGAPAGDPGQAPPPPHWTRGWNIPPPDAVITMPQAVPLPARGQVDYTYEIVPTHFDRDEWVQFSQIEPSAPDHVHHAVVYIRPPGSSWLRHAPVGVPFTAKDLRDPQDRRDAEWTDSDLLLVYAPGSSPDHWPATMAKFVPRGSDLVFQMHYITNGRAARDRTRIGLVFDRQRPRYRVLTLQLTDDHFLIPPGAPNFEVEVHGTLPNRALLLGFFPHLHLRGKTFEYNLVHRDGRVETLLRVHWNFYWQLSYKLAQPRRLAAGTELQAIAWFDNSAANPHNPDPTQWVHWGDQTSEEMMVGFFDVAVPAGMSKRQFFLRRRASRNRN